MNLVPQEQDDSQRVKYIEFIGTKSGDKAVITFVDQHGTLIGRFPLNRFAVETIAQQTTEWIKKTE